MLPDGLSGEDYCYLTTTGRKSGRPHTIEIWFSLSGLNLYMLSGGGDRSDWVRNIQSTPEVTVRIGGSSFQGWGYMVEDPEEEELARKLLFDKYQPRYAGDLTRWRGSALPVAVGLGGPPPEYAGNS